MLRYGDDLAGQVRDEEFFEAQLAILEGLVEQVLTSGELPGRQADVATSQAEPPRRLAVV